MDDADQRPTEMLRLCLRCGAPLGSSACACGTLVNTAVEPPPTETALPTPWPTLETPPASWPTVEVPRAPRQEAPWRPVVLVLLVGLLAAALAFGLWTRSQPDEGAPPTATIVPTALATPTSLPPPAILASTPSPVPIIAPPAAPVPTSTAVPTSTPAPSPTETPSPTADQAWAETLAQLDEVWQRDWDRAIALLEAFQSAYPDFQPAAEKLYAALVASGERLIRAGDVEAGSAQLQRARDLLPERSEAPAALLALTPTPTSPPRPAVRPPAPPPPDRTERDRDNRDGRDGRDDRDDRDNEDD